MQKNIIFPTFFSLAIKVIVFFTASLYLITFGFYGVNIYGLIDSFIPFERTMLFFIGVILFCLCLNSVRELSKKYLEIIKK